MMNRMIAANLRRRPMRTAVSVLAVGIEVALILMIVGLTNGMVNDSRNRQAGIGADIVARANSGSQMAALSGNSLPLADGRAFVAQPGVIAVAPVGLQFNGNSLSTVSGIDLASFDTVSGGFHFLRGHAFAPGSNEVIIDDREAESKQEHVGDSVKLLGQTFTITGIFYSGKGSRLYMDLSVLDKLAGTPDKAAAFYIKLTNPADTDAVVKQLQTLAPSLTIQPFAEYLSMFTASGISPMIPIFQAVMIGIAVTIGFLVIFLSMYTTILERTREIGILKSLGASRAYIVQAILRESELLAALGVVAGIGIAYGLVAILARRFPTLTIELTAAWVGYGALIALASSAIGSFYPAMKAATQDAIAALAYE